MHEALYGEQGFYMVGGRAGRKGDFITSPEVGPLFGAVVARFLDSEWLRIGRPAEFVVVDAGAGPGSLGRAVLAAAPQCIGALQFVSVDVSPLQRGLNSEHVQTSDCLPDGPFDGVIIANELLDNLPFRLAVFDSQWREAFVVEGEHGVFEEILSAPFDPVPAVLPQQAQHGSRAPLQDNASAWVNDATQRLRSGSVVVFDYASYTTAELVARPWRDWLRTYRNHQRGAHYLNNPGSQDITAEVALDQLPPPDVVSTQSEWLTRNGIVELEDEGKRVWFEQAARPGLEAMRMRSRISESEALLDDSGLGAFIVCEWRVG